jgi:hypothetical protein
MSQDVLTRVAQAQIDQFFETASENGYKVGVQPGLIDPSLWKLSFANMNLSLQRDQLFEDLEKAGLTVVNRRPRRPPNSP